MHRVLVHLQGCDRLDGRPPFIPQPRRLVGTKAKGLSFERKVGKVLRDAFGLEVHSGAWFEFRDRNGVGCCQPDHFVLFERVVLLVECKLSERDEAWGQMHKLYKPVLEFYFKRPVVCVQACRFLKSGRGLIYKIQDALARPWEDHLWHLLI
jgi:hypothetical protein